jgi:hypothetical protein
MGAQTEPMLFLLLGWGESIKNRSEKPDTDAADTETEPKDHRPFRKIIQ